jgi:hypothetical protein
MTREEALRELMEIRDEATAYPDAVCYVTSEDEDALNVAIEALSTPTAEDLIIKGAKGIKDGLYNIQNGELFQYKAKGGTVRAYPIVEQKMGGAE